MAAKCAAMEGAGREQTLNSESAKRKIADNVELARQKAMEVAARLNNAAVAKRPRIESPSATATDASFSADVSHSYPVFTAQTGQYNGMQGSNKKICIPNGKVGVIIGRGGEMIKNLQLQSGAKIQITRDADADPTSGTRDVELMGTPEQMSRAEQLITDLIAETDAAGSGGSSGNRPFNPVHPGSEQSVIKVPNDKVALIIGKGGETIKSMQSQSGAHIKVVPLHPPPGDMSPERSVYISGTKEQIDAAKELINDVMSGNRLKTYSGSTGYNQAGYPPSSGWASQGQPPVQQQQAGYGYGHQGSYGLPAPYYGSYPQQASWDQTNPSAVPPQSQQNTGYNMYGQQVQSTTATPSAGYNYNQVPPSSTYNYNQGYGQQSYGQDASSQAPPTGSSQPDSASAAQTSQPGYGAHTDSGTGQTGYTQEATNASLNGYGTYAGYGAPPSYNQAGYGQMGYGQQGAQAPPQGSYPYYGQSGYPQPPAQANYYQGNYPPQQASGQPLDQSAGGVAQPTDYGEKTDDGNLGAGSATATKETDES